MKATYDSTTDFALAVFTFEHSAQEPTVNI